MSSKLFETRTRSFLKSSGEQNLTSTISAAGPDDCLTPTSYRQKTFFVKSMTLSVLSRPGVTIFKDIYSWPIKGKLSVKLFVSEKRIIPVIADENILSNILISTMFAEISATTPAEDIISQVCKSYSIMVDGSCH